MNTKKRDSVEERPSGGVELLDVETEIIRPRRPFFCRPSLSERVESRKARKVIVLIAEVGEEVLSKASKCGKLRLFVGLSGIVRAEHIARSILKLSSGVHVYSEPIGVLFRSLWEGAVVFNYVGRNFDRRIAQMTVDMVRNEQRMRKSSWLEGLRIKSPDEDQLKKELVILAVKAEKEYKRNHKASKERGERPVFDWDKCAGLPSVPAMAKECKIEDQYTVLYRGESANVHWTLESLFRFAINEKRGVDRLVRFPQKRLCQVLGSAAVAYGMLILECSRFAEVDVEGRLVSAIQSLKR